MTSGILCQSNLQPPEQADNYHVNEKTTTTWRHTNTRDGKLLHPSKPLRLQIKTSKALTPTLHSPHRYSKAAAQPLNALLTPVRRAPQGVRHLAGSGGRGIDRGRRGHRHNTSWGPKLGAGGAGVETLQAAARRDGAVVPFE